MAAPATSTASASPAMLIQNHLMQLLALTAMEEPTSFEASQLRAEKQKVLAAVEPPKRMDLETARGAYTGGWAGGEQVKGYLEEDRIPRDSRTETFAAIRVDIDNRRWARCRSICARASGWLGV